MWAAILVRVQILQVCMNVLEMFQKEYRGIYYCLHEQRFVLSQLLSGAVDNVKLNYWQSERRKPRYYVEYMVRHQWSLDNAICNRNNLSLINSQTAIANNCHSCTEFTEQMKVSVCLSTIIPFLSFLSFLLFCLSFVIN